MVAGNKAKIRGFSCNITRLLNRIPSLKKEYLYTAVACCVLFSLFFLFGSTGNSNGTISPTTTRLEDCLEERVNSKPLDFRSSHDAESTLLTHAPNSTTARGFHAPPCSASMSEYTPCQDVKRSLRFDRERLVYRERHCPEGSDEALRCRVPAPNGYRVPMRWPESRDWAWYANVPHKELTVEKKEQNWVHYESGRFRFPGGGTMFPNGADAYIDDIGELIDLRGGGIRTAVDTGCGVASWGGYLLSRDVLTMSFAPRDTHEAQVQFALERGIPAMIGILASMRLPYPSRAFDMAHCSRCLIPWGQYDGLYLIEVDRILRPGGYWILSGPPINWENHWSGWDRSKEDLSEEQTGIENVATSLCWKLIKKKGDLAIWQKPTNHIHCHKTKRIFKTPKFCDNQDPDTAWYTKMEDCLTPLPDVKGLREVAGGEVAKWPERLNSVPPRIAAGTVLGVTEEIFQEDTAVWKNRVEYYKRLDGQLAERGRYRNLLDMNAYLGGFAAALVHDPVWVMNVQPAQARPNTLGVIFERGLIGTYHDWCEAMSTYPRTYDFIHADSIFTIYSSDKCEVGDILLEMDRVLRPEGSVIVRDDVDMVVKVKKMLEAMQYVTRIVDHEDGPLERHKILLAKKLYWTAPKPASSSNHTQTNHTF